MMFWKKKPSVLEAVRNLSGEEKQTIREYLDDGFLPNEISRILQLPLGKVQIFADAHVRQQRKYGLRPSSEKDDIRKIEEQIKLEKSKAELEILKQQNAMLIENQKLELEKKQLDIDEKRMEIFGEDEEEDEMNGLMGNFTEVIKAAIASKFTQQQPQPQQTMQQYEQPVVSHAVITPPNSTPVTSITDEQIYNTLDSLSEQEYQYVINLSDEALRNLLIQKFPQLPEETIARAMQLVHEEKLYGNTPENK